MMKAPQREARADSMVVSKPYDCWIKVKNPAAPAARRLEEEDWGR